MRHRQRFSFLALALLSACSSGREGHAPLPPLAPSALSAAAPETARLRSDVSWLADDARKGRRAGTEDAKLVAKWLAERLSSLGLDPAGPDGYLQAFDVPLAAAAGETSLVRVATDTGSRMVSEFKKVMPLFCSEGATAEGPLCFRGYGIESLDQEWDDFASGDVKGAIVVILRGTPPASELLPAKPAAEGEVEHTASFEGTGSIFMKVMNAKHHGAAGVILLQEAGATEPLPFDASQAARADIPALSAPRSVFEALVGEETARALFERADHRAHGDFGAPDPALQVRMVSDVRRDRGTAYNVLARLPGTDATRTVVIGAHYDHLGLGGEGSLAPGKTGEIHNGADDNASGTAVVLEMARILSRSPRPAGDVIFALWSGEELGLLGSEYWVEHPPFPLERVRANLNLDMVGRARAPGEAMAKPNLIVLGAGTSQVFEAWLAPAANAAGLSVQVNRSGYGEGGSDHMSFMNQKIPVLHFFTGTHADYHRPGDDTDKVDCDSMARIAVLGIDLVTRMQAEASLAWNESEPQLKGQARPVPAPSNRGFSVWFGSVPSYGFEGPGVLLTGTSPGSPAEKAGLLAGDVLLQVGSVQIDSIHDFSYALKIYKPGDVVLTRFARGGIEQSVRIPLALKGAQ